MSSRVQPYGFLSKKELGAFYTHSGLSNLICSWAIQDSSNTVLEPSFGGCGFLRSSRDRIVALGSSTADKQIFGCDIDPNAFSHLANVFERPVALANFVNVDFLDQTFPNRWPSDFDVVVGNPPYLPYRKIVLERRESVREQLSLAGLELDRRASLWAYFVALGVLRVGAGGRMAWVLPSSFLYANYARNLRHFVAASFTDVCAFELKERQFLTEGTEEKTVVLLCRSRRSQTTPISDTDIPLVECEGIKDLPIQIDRWEAGEEDVTATCASSVFDSLSATQRNLVQTLSSRDECKSLGDFLDVRIGLVTGNNSFFLFDEASREKSGLSERQLVRVLPRFHFASGIRFSLNDHDILLEAGGKGRLLSVQRFEDASVEAQDYLAGYDQVEMAKCSTFKKRQVWSQTDDGAPPDAFLPVMQHFGPRLVLNEDRINCTNSIHRAYFKTPTSQHARKLVALSLLSSFSQISAEVCGRSYGSGALKHEPREAEKIQILVPKLHHRTVSAVFKRADMMLREGNLAEARQYVDCMILGAMEIDGVIEMSSVFSSALEQLRKKRHR